MKLYYVVGGCQIGQLSIVKTAERKSAKGGLTSIVVVPMVQFAARLDVIGIKRVGVW